MRRLAADLLADPLLHLLLLALLLLTLAGCQPSPSPVPSPLPDPAHLGAELLLLHNTERARVGLPPLTWDVRLYRSAAVQANECARLDRLSHVGTDGSWPWDRTARQGYPGLAISENAAEGQSTAAEAMADWMTSPGHRANVLGSYSQMGAAAAIAPTGRRYWIADFGTP